MKTKYLIINKEITQLNIELDKRKRIEYKINRNSNLLIFHNYTKSLHFNLKLKEDYNRGKQKKSKTKPNYSGLHDLHLDIVTCKTRQKNKQRKKKIRC
jgi:hypothetical protein